jgi:glycosyltransferase involved in cell wall biosynthesis
MQILFIHQNFPGQYRYLARHFTDHPDWDCYAIGQRDNVMAQGPMVPAKIKMLGYDAPPAVVEGVPPHAKEFVAQVGRAQAISQVLLRQKKNGLDPDIICAHPGWGEGFYLREIFPRAKLLFFFEFNFEPEGPVIDFDPELPNSLSERMGYRVKNAQNLISLDMADAGISPTRWQWQTFPKEYRDKVRVIHDGVDTSAVVPDPGARLNFPRSAYPDKVFTAADEIISFSVRNLEPSRGFHRFMRVLPKLQKLRPNAQFIIVGGDEKSYVKGHASGKSWREVMLEEVGGQLDMSRVFFLGRIPYPQLLGLFSITSLHIYMTIPFVLSWSMLEAMACCAPVLASSTQPVTEVITDGENGFLFDYFSEQELVDQVGRLMDDPELRRRVGAQAREFVMANYDLNNVCLPQQLALIDELVRAK